MGCELKVIRKVLTRAAVLGLCSSAAVQLAIFSPSAVAAPPGAATAHRPIAAVKVKKPVMQLGAGIDLYTYAKQDWASASADEVTYLKALNANSVMVSFPFYIAT
jgi:predicted lipoprotein with Yx(FWY)xxD motif